MCLFLTHSFSQNCLINVFASQQAIYRERNCNPRKLKFPAVCNFREGYFDYVVPPLEGFWWQDGGSGIDYARKDGFNFISLIRLPDFVTKADFDWAVQKAAEKKQADFSRAELFAYDEGLCVQCMHVGSYDNEPATVERMHEYMRENGCELDISSTRFHHEIYLSDPRKCAAEKLRTVVRHPVRKV